MSVKEGSTVVVLLLMATLGQMYDFGTLYVQ